MSSKGKKNRNNGSAGESKEHGAETGTSASTATAKSRKPRTPLGTVPERLVDKADHIHTLANDALRLLEKRGGPTPVTTKTQAFLAQVEAWREELFNLKTSGWLPPDPAASKDIVEGDAVKIVKDQHATYQYIFDALGVAAGEEDLVAGTVVTTGRLSRVLVKSKDVMENEVVVKPGQVFGYVSRTHLVKR